MIFGPDLAALALAGRKVETRRLCPTAPDGTILPVRCRYRPGRTYAVQTRRGGRAVGRIRVLAVRREPLGAITPEAARREGFESPALFLDRWRALHGRADPDAEVWVLSFEPADT